MPNGHARYRFAGFVLDAGEHRLHAGGRDVYLPPKTFETLLVLVSRAGHLVTKADLLDAIWPGVAVTENALTRCVKEVRAALADEVHAPRFVETVPRVGYRFIAPVQVETDAEAAPASVPGLASTAEVAHDPTPPPAAAVGLPATPAAHSTAWRGWGRHVATLVVLSAVLVLVPVGSYLATPPGAAISFGPRDFVLVADLDNQTGDPQFDRSLMTAFTSLLEQSRFANVYPRAGAVETLKRMGRPADAAIDESIGREVCQRDDIRGLVVTTLAGVGAAYAVSARLIDPLTGRAVRARVEEAADRDHVLDALRRVAAGLRSDLGESLSSIRTTDHALERVTTTSLDALKRYTEGMVLWQRGEHRAALQAYLAAVAADPGFAAGHAALGAAYYSFVFGDREKGREHFERAIALADRTTDREQRGIRAAYAFQAGRLGEAVSLYRAYLQSYPDDFRTRHNYAGVLRRLSRFDEAVAQYEEVLRAAPTYAASHINLAVSCSALGRYDEAIAHYDAAFALEPSWRATPNINHEYGFLLVRAGQAATARAVFEQALETAARPSALRSLALLDMYQGRYRDAARRLDEALALGGAPGATVNDARNRLFLSMVRAAQGDEAAARREVVRAIAAARAARANAWLLARIGVAAARLGMTADADAILGGVRSRTDGSGAEQAADLHRLEGEILSARGQHAAALTRLRHADGVRRSAFTVESLARAERLAGHADEAIRQYETLIAMQNISLGFEPQQGWVEAHYHLAALSAARGDLDGAARGVRALQALLADADPDLPLLHAAGAIAGAAPPALAGGRPR